MRHLLVSYDVNVTTTAGKRRWRHICKTCKNYGQRVQFSVFEVQVNEAQREALIHKLKTLINEEEDSIRIYNLPTDRDANVISFGLDSYCDYQDPLVI